MWSGRGYETNPIFIAKRTSDDDFFEAIGIYYETRSKKVAVCCVKDSLRQINVTSSEKFELTKWHHLAVTFDDNFLSFYINGKLEKKIVKNFRTTFDQHLPILLGVSSNRKNNRFSQGVFDDIEIYNTILSPAEIQILFEAPNPNTHKILLNWLLNGLGILTIVSITYFYVKRRMSFAMKKQKLVFQLANSQLENELKINRSLMNPHFIFNSLNTLHNLILRNDFDKANHYLIRFSKLTRKILENNSSNSVLLSQEIELLMGYIEIEGLRFEKEIHYSVDIDPHISPSSTFIPTMMLQPFVENAIWHGLLKKDGEKFIHISFFLHENNYVLCSIEDNGVGRNKNKDQKPGEKKSLATIFVSQRLELLNKLYGFHCYLTIEDKPENSGTVVKTLLPILKA